MKSILKFGIIISLLGFGLVSCGDDDNGGGKVSFTAPSGLNVKSVNYNNASLEWNNVAAADKYEVELTGGLDTVATVLENAIIFRNIKANATYNWRVRSVRGAGETLEESAWVAGESFTTPIPEDYTKGMAGKWEVTGIKVDVEQSNSENLIIPISFVLNGILSSFNDCVFNVELENIPDSYNYMQFNLTGFDGISMPNFDINTDINVFTGGFKYEEVLNILYFLVDSSKNELYSLREHADYIIEVFRDNKLQALMPDSVANPLRESGEIFYLPFLPRSYTVEGKLNSNNQLVLNMQLKGKWNIFVQPLRQLFLFGLWDEYTMTSELVFTKKED